MKTYPVKITDRALGDMEALYNYIAEELSNPEAAIGQYDRIAEAIEALSAFPERHRLLDSHPEHELGMRMLPVDNFAVIYAVLENEVAVLRVLYGASNIHARLMEA